MTDIEKRATDFALKEIRCKSVDELEQLGTEIAKKAFEEIRNDYIRIATEQKAIDIDRAQKAVCQFICTCETKCKEPNMNCEMIYFITKSLKED